MTTMQTYEVGAILTQFNVES